MREADRSYVRRDGVVIVPRSDQAHHQERISAVNPKNKIDNADKKTTGVEQDTTGPIVAGSAAHETEGDADQPEPNLTQAGEKTKKSIRD
jgi:hypothetical protein